MIMPSVILLLITITYDVSIDRNKKVCLCDLIFDDLRLRISIDPLFECVTQ